MKCISCEIEINPKWKHAIDRNICPFCGQSIMEELLKGLLSTLQDTMEKLQSYPDQVNDWLLSNYDFIKTNSPDLVSYVPKEVIKELKKELDSEDFDRKRTTIKVRTADGQEEEVVTEKIQSDSKTAGFFERSGLIRKGAGDEGRGDENLDTGEQEPVPFTPHRSQKPAKPKSFKTAAERTKYLKELKAKIETESSQGIISEKGLVAMIDPSNLDNVDPEDVAALQSAIGSGDIINSALPVPLDDDEDGTTKRVLSMNLAASNRNSPKGHDGGYNEKDARALQNLVDKANSANMGGGFSRS